MFVIGLYNSIDLGLNIKGLLIAVICIVIVILLVKFFLDYFEERKVNKILRNHKSKNNESSKKDTSKKNYKKMIPFSKRESKQGLNWGGGNIKGAIPKRGNKKEFLKWLIFKFTKSLRILHNYQNLVDDKKEVLLNTEEIHSKDIGYFRT